MCVRRTTRWLVQWFMGTSPSREELTSENYKQSEAAKRRLEELTRRMDALDHNIGILADRQRGRMKS